MFRRLEILKKIYIFKESYKVDLKTIITHFKVDIYLLLKINFEGLIRPISNVLLIEKKFQVMLKDMK